MSPTKEPGFRKIFAAHLRVDARVSRRIVLYDRSKLWDDIVVECEFKEFAGEYARLMLIARNRGATDPCLAPCAWGQFAFTCIIPYQSQACLPMPCVTSNQF